MVTRYDLYNWSPTTSYEISLVQKIVICSHAQMLMSLILSSDELLRVSNNNSAHEVVTQWVGH